MLEKVTQMRSQINERIENEIKPSFEKSKTQLVEYNSKIEFLHDEFIA